MRTFDYRAGDVGYVLNQWMKLPPPELARSHLNIGQPLLAGKAAVATGCQKHRASRW